MDMEEKAEYWRNIGALRRDVQEFFDPIRKPEPKKERPSSGEDLAKAKILQGENHDPR